MDKIIISDIHCEYHFETGYLEFIVEFPSGEEKIIRQLVPEDVPTFATVSDDDEIELTDYEDWYNEALKDAYNQGYILEGEKGGN